MVDRIGEDGSMSLLDGVAAALKGPVAEGVVCTMRFTTEGGRPVAVSLLLPDSDGSVPGQAPWELDYSLRDGGCLPPVYRPQGVSVRELVG